MTSVFRLANCLITHNNEEEDAERTGIQALMRQVDTGKSMKWLLTANLELSIAINPVEGIVPGR